MSCCSRKLVITEEDRSHILSLYDLMTEAEASDGSYVIDFSATFASGKWKETSIKNLPQLQQDLAGAKEWMSKNKGKVVFVQIEASESKVPNADAELPNKPVLEPYVLSNRRAVTINNYLAKIFDGWMNQKLISSRPVFEFPTPTIGGPEWDPKLGSGNQVYTEHQFVRVRLKLQPPETCLTGLKIDVNYYKTPSPAFPCRGGHTCDQALFDVNFNGVTIGVANLNNAADGGDRLNSFTVTAEQAKKILGGQCKDINISLKCKYKSCHSATPEITISKGNYVYPGFPRCMPSITERDDYSLKHLLNTDCCGNIKKSNNDIKQSLPDENKIQKPADLKSGYVFWNEDTKQFEFSPTPLEDDGILELPDGTNHHWWVRHSLMGGGHYQSESFTPPVPAEVYKVGCNSPDKADYGGFCIWSGPKMIYKNINRAAYPPYGELSRIEKWKLGRNTGQVYPITMSYNGPDGHRWTVLSGPGKETAFYTNDSKKKNP
jgi:hypothetical protein